MDNALGSCLVEQTAGGKCRCVCFFGIASSDCFADATNAGFQFRLDSAITHTRFLVGDDALLLTLDVCHSYPPL